VIGQAATRPGTAAQKAWADGIREFARLVPDAAEKFAGIADLTGLLP